ncbi:hypothetical protein EZV62_026846 [Acer yangbiense]|uniref:Peptidase C1A papain C-terminal domain-containing protein n=1 Tax=Acer yangbiense TaxID=1000413 RepID=A0A5C7GTA5_9ROSI|nr:hypothetical protein EZV62_026846 [Acer yangbiense]
MEGINQLSTGKLISLSEQELVDCDISGEDQGCNGIGWNLQLHMQPRSLALTKQPISVAIDAGDSDFQFYSSGIFTGQRGTELGHGVIVVRYGTIADGTKYWMQRDIDVPEGLCSIAMESSYPTAT